MVVAEEKDIYRQDGAPYIEKQKVRERAMALLKGMKYARFTEMRFSMKICAHRP